MSSNEDHFSILDRPEVLAAIFHPRAELGRQSEIAHKKDHLIEVASGVSVGARFHMKHPIGANILFFHGNGEIVADYDDIAPLYHELGINFLPVDFRGYGRSSGQPTVSAMMTDCHVVLHYTKKWLEQNAFSGPLIVMGRSLGSAPALELAAAHPEEIDGLIIESGFAHAEPLLRLLGVPTDRIGFKEAAGFNNTEKIALSPMPTLVIHAQYDHIIPFANGRTLYEASKADWKRLVQIEGADHNDLLYVGLNAYLTAIQTLVQHLRNEDKLEKA